MMKILIVEDEPQTAGVLQDIISKIRPGLQVIGVTESIAQTVKYLSGSGHQPDLIFMDIQLADGLSFEVFSRIQVKSPVIFCTAYDQYTLQAFKVNGIEYILKPIKEDDVRAALEKLETLRQSFNPDAEILSIVKDAFGSRKSFKTSLLVRYRESFIPIAVSNIALFYVDSEIVYAITFDNQKYPIFKPISEVEGDINPNQFYRINRQALVNRDAIKEIQPYFNRKVIVKTHLKFNGPLVVSRLKVTDFMEWVELP
ncbi:MAG: LytR/AlgR family response regulator transcription factor [Bacteroidales bacterium]